MESLRFQESLQNETGFPSVRPIKPPRANVAMQSEPIPVVHRGSQSRTIQSADTQTELEMFSTSTSRKQPEGYHEHNDFIAEEQSLNDFLLKVLPMVEEALQEESQGIFKSTAAPAIH